MYDPMWYRTIDLEILTHLFTVAPRKYQKILSFSVGFFGVLGWQTSLAATCYVHPPPIISGTTVANIP